MRHWKKLSEAHARGLHSEFPPSEFRCNSDCWCPNFEMACVFQNVWFCVHVVKCGDHAWRSRFTFLWTKCDEFHALDLHNALWELGPTLYEVLLFLSAAYQQKSALSSPLCIQGDNLDAYQVHSGFIRSKSCKTRQAWHYALKSGQHEDSTCGNTK